MTYLTVLAAFLPYLRTSPLTSDIQPHFLVIFFALYLPTCAVRIGRQKSFVLAAAAAFFYALVALALGAYQEAISVLFVPIFTVALAYEDEKPVSAALKTVLAIYALGVALQIAGGMGALQGMVANLRTSEVRGFTSFASEPSYLSIVALAAMTYCLYTRQGPVWQVVCGALALLSGSVAGLVPLLVVWFLHYMQGFDFRRVLLFILFLLFVIFIVTSVIDANSRLAVITTQFYHDPLYIFEDVSASNRLIRSFGLLYMAWQDYFLPHQSIHAALPVEWSFVPNRSDLYIDSLSNIMSIVAYLFGILALPAIVVAARYVRAPLYVIVSAVYLMFTNISMATPYVCLVFALLYRKRIIQHAGRLRGRTCQRSTVAPR